LEKKKKKKKKRDEKQENLSVMKTKQVVEKNV